MRANQSSPSIDGSAQIRAAKGASWLIAGKFSAKIMDALVLVVLARLLGPTDFGLVALAMSFVVISEAILEIPVSQALLIVPDLTEDHLNTAFTLGFIRAMIIVVTIAILSYPLAHFTGEPRLTNLLDHPRLRAGHPGRREPEADCLHQGSRFSARLRR
ncbi:oligosaccharide flippase family protein [Methylobacterium phyllosphaerae]